MAAEPQTENQKRAAGATEKLEAKSAIVNFAWKLKKEGYCEATIKEYCYILQTLLKRGANPYDSKSVKDCITRQETLSVAPKSIVVKAYTSFLKTQGLSWNPQKYRIPQRLPFIPLEKELDDLIACCSSQMATFLQLLKERGTRCEEAFNLKWTDADLAKNTVRITPEKEATRAFSKFPPSLRLCLQTPQRSLLKSSPTKTSFTYGKALTNNVKE